MIIPTQTALVVSCEIVYGRLSSILVIMGLNLAAGITWLGLTLGYNSYLYDHMNSLVSALGFLPAKDGFPHDDLCSMASTACR